MNTPNLFNFATSELSQDATLAYILAWAKPEYREQHPVLNQLGESLLRALVKSWAIAAKAQDPLSGEQILSLSVGTQKKHIDIWIEINDDLLLIIEDKTGTTEHSNQIERYLQNSENDWPKRKAMAVYVKTGNECPIKPGGDTTCGIFLRPDLLKVLDAFPDTGNNIIEEFHLHLRQWQNDTDSYLTTPITGWSWSAKQGFYNHLNQWLYDLQWQDEPLVWSDWKYVANQSGGFLGFWWHWRSFPRLKCQLYLQIEDAHRLQIRASDAKDEDGNDVKVHKDLMYAVYDVIQGIIKQQRVKKVRAEKSGRYRGGKFGSVVDLFFDEDETYIATNNRGIIDLSTTMERIVLAMDFVEMVCDSIPEVQA